MHITSDLQLTAWSGDGGSALVRRAESGPEGGGATTWLVVNAAGARTYAISSTMSPGDGSTPEQISVTTCKAAAKDLAVALASFDGVKVRPDRCAGDRGNVVQVDPAQADRAAKSFAPAGTAVTRTGKTIRVSRDGQKVEIVKVDHRAKEIAWASAGPLVLVLERGGEVGDALLAAVVQTPAGMVTVPVE